MKGSIRPSAPTASRFFSRRAPDPDEIEISLHSDKNNKGAMLSAADMEFFNHESGFDLDDEDEEEETDLAEYRRKQEAIQKELDTRTGRPWTDEWEISEEQWMASTNFKDLPDWSPDQVSRVSQERVQIYPGM